MKKFLRTIDQLPAGLLAVILLAVAWSPGAEAATRKVKCGKDDLQKVITAAVSGDTIEITGICLANIVLTDKVLTLIGASSAGPHGITGVTETDAVSIIRSPGTHLERLTITHPSWSSVRTHYSTVTMTDCSVSSVFTAIWAEEFSTFTGTRLQLNGSTRGLGANKQSRAYCYECSLDGNTSWAASAFQNSVLSLLDSVVTGRNGIEAQGSSYIDIDCASHVSSTPGCSLNATQRAGRALGGSTVLFYGVGPFSGQVSAADRSLAQLAGAQQQSTGLNNNNVAFSNSVSSNSSLRVEPGDDGVNPVESRLMGTTNVSEFSNALLYADTAGGDSALVGALNCTSGGDAWVDAGVDLSAGSINDCDHAAP